MQLRCRCARIHAQSVNMNPTTSAMHKTTDRPPIFRFLLMFLGLLSLALLLATLG
jgi:hypothetical protein